MTHSSNEELRIGDRIAGRYEILGIIGQGSMGVVYKCRHDILGRVVAIKTLRLGHAAVDDRTQKRFEREARLASRLDHPNLIGVHDFGYTANGDPYLVMDFVSGQSLYEIMKRERYLIPERAVNLFSQVCDGLYHAHQRGVIHRDLKPANILVIKNESGPEAVKIVDLGVAKIVHGGNEEESEAITMTGEVCGSPIYLSPEQCMYHELDARTDIYSLGVCLYECLTGVPPLKGATVYDTIYMHVNEMPRPFSQLSCNPDIPAELEAAVFRCLAKQAKDRFETMIQLKHDLVESMKAGRQISGVNVLPPESLFGQRPKSARASVQSSTPDNASGQISAPGIESEHGRPDKQAANAALSAHQESGISQESGAQYQQTGDNRRNLKGKAENEKSFEELEESQASPAAAKNRKTGNRSATDSRSKPKTAKPEKAGNPLSMGVPDPLSMRKLVLLCGALSVFGLSFGLGFAYLLTTMNQQNRTPKATADKNSEGKHAEPSFEINQLAAPAKNQAKSPGYHADPAGKSGSVKVNKPPAAQTNKAPERALSLNDMENLLDTGRFPEGSQSRFQSIVKKMPDKPGTKPSQASRSSVKLKPGHHLPQARPMPVLTHRSPMGNRQMPGMPGMGMSGGANSPSTGMGMGSMQQGYPGSGLGMGAIPGMGGMPGAGQGPAASPAAGHGIMDKIKAFVASQSGGGGNQSGSPLSQFIPGSGGGQNYQSGSNGASMAQQEKDKLFIEGNKLAGNKQYQEALQKFEAAHRIDPNDSSVTKMFAWTLNSRAIELNKSGKYAEAVQYAHKAVSLEPGNSLYRNNLAGYTKNLEAHQSGGF